MHINNNDVKPAASQHYVRQMLGLSTFIKFRVFTFQGASEINFVHCGTCEPFRVEDGAIKCLPNADTYLRNQAIAVQKIKTLTAVSVRV
jgi:hypothetical protein